jgi:hypothetical protein
LTKTSRVDQMLTVEPLVVCKISKKKHGWGRLDELIDYDYLITWTGGQIKLWRANLFSVVGYILEKGNTNRIPRHPCPSLAQHPSRSFRHHLGFQALVSAPESLHKPRRCTAAVNAIAGGLHRTPLFANSIHPCSVWLVPCLIGSIVSIDWVMSRLVVLVYTWDLGSFDFNNDGSWARIESEILLVERSIPRTRILGSLGSVE